MNIMIGVQFWAIPPVQAVLSKKNFVLWFMCNFVSVHVAVSPGSRSMGGGGGGSVGKERMAIFHARPTAHHSKLVLPSFLAVHFALKLEPNTLNTQKDDDNPYTNNNQ